MKQAINEYSRLYRACFDDTPEQVAFVTSKLATDDTVCLEINNETGKVVAGLLLLPYELKLGTEIHSITYIYGACTYPEYRRQGFMHNLIKTAIKKSRDRGAELCTLIPANEKLFHYYAKLRFETMFYKNRVPFTHRNEFVEIDPKELKFEDFHQAEMLSQNNIIHSPQDFENIITDCMLEGGRCLTRKTDDKIDSIIFLAPHDQEWIIKAALGDAMIEKELYNSSASPYGMGIHIKDGLEIPHDTHFSLMLD